MMTLMAYHRRSVSDYEGSCNITLFLSEQLSCMLHVENSIFPMTHFELFTADRINLPILHTSLFSLFAPTIC